MTLTDVVKHVIDGVAEVGDLAGNRLGLLFQQVVEFAALVGERFDGFLHLGESDFAGRNELLHLVFGHAKLLCQLLCKGYAAAGELAEVLRKESPLGHGCAIQVDEVVQGNGEPGGDVSESDKGVVDLAGGYAIRKQLLGTACDALHVEWCGGGRLCELLHELVCLCLAAEHGFEGHFQLLELAAHGGHFDGEVFSHVERKGYAHHRAHLLSRLSEAFDDVFSFGGIAPEAAVVYAGGHVKGTVVIKYSHVVEVLRGCAPVYSLNCLRC